MNPEETGVIDCPAYSITRNERGTWHAIIKWQSSPGHEDLGCHATWQGAYMKIKDWFGDEWWD